MRRRVTKAEWYRRGGFKNSDCLRRHKHGYWTYWVLVE